MKTHAVVARKNLFVARVSAFTLVELLVVIAIIAMLAAILFPVFARARENARRSNCQSNLKQMGVGIMQYTQDYNECFPMGVTVNAPPGQTVNDLVQPYLKNERIFICPSDAAPLDMSWSYLGTGYNKGSSYGFNDRVITVPVMTPLTPNPPKALSAINQASKTTLMYDALNTKAGYLGQTYCATRHLEGGNVLYCDGHVKWTNTKPEHSQTNDRWNSDPAL